MTVRVGVIANPASGRDIRRLVAGASVYGNADKAAMVYRLLVGLGAVGVEHVLMMPAGDGLWSTLQRHLRARASGRRDGVRLPDLDAVRMPVTGTAADTVVAVERLLAAGVGAIAVLGGDGTHRLVAEACGDLPICALSTGTNNAFPELRETTVAGLATGLVAVGAVPDGVRRDPALAVEVGAGPPTLALVDVAASGARHVGARALWRAGDVRELCVAFASPTAIGLSSIAGLLQPVGRSEPRGLHVRLAPPAEADTTLDVAMAPGLIVPIGVRSHRVVEQGEVVFFEPAAGALALDGERELQRRGDDAVRVRLVEGPRVVDVDAVMRRAARERLLEATGRQPPRS